MPNSRSLIKTAKIAILLILALFVVLYLANKVTHPPKGRLVATSLSPGGRWRVRIYEVDPGAMASLIFYAHVSSLTRKGHNRDIALSGEKMQKQNIRWKNMDTVDLFGAETNVRTGTVLDATSISPNRRWKVKVFYYVLPENRRYWSWGRAKFYYYLAVEDLKKRVQRPKIRFNDSQITDYRIVWKSNNLIDVYGVKFELGRQ